uniref:Uncharacterized protein n=1 Tax=Ditylenchus dipsaci TaxID=166011 RepID=A0A915ENZ0_9BILA
MLTINRNSSTEQPPNWRSNLKDDWDQLILEDKIKLLYYSIWAIIASGFMFLIFTPASDTDDEVRKKEMVDWECKSSFVHEKEINEDVNGLVQKNMEVSPKNNFVMIEKRKLAKLLQLEKTVATLHDVLTKSEQVLMKTNADIHKTRNTLHKLEENLDFYKEHAQAITADKSVLNYIIAFRKYGVA